MALDLMVMILVRVVDTAVALAYYYIVCQFKPNHVTIGQLIGLPVVLSFALVLGLGLDLDQLLPALLPVA